MRGAGVGGNLADTIAFHMHPVFLVLEQEAGLHQQTWEQEGSHGVGGLEDTSFYFSCIQLVLSFWMAVLKQLSSFVFDSVVLQASVTDCPCFESYILMYFTVYLYFWFSMSYFLDKYLIFLVLIM